MAAPLVAAAPSPSLLIIKESDMERMRASASAKSTVLDPLVRKALRSGPWSVTFKRPTGVDASANDYYSEGPYWWPDPKNPKGPYIRKDGERNPERFMGNRSDLGALCENVLALGIGAALRQNKECIVKGAEILNVWFLDSKTRMNPNLEYGQAVRGRNTGRGTGIIDTVSLIHCAQGVALLENAGLDAAVTRGVRQWYADYLKWMTTSAKGLDEKKTENNHGTWWTAQVVAFAAFTSNNDASRMAWERFKTVLIPTQIEPDGSCPREEARTQSLSYSSMNLDGFAVICHLASNAGANLWQFRTAKGTGVQTSIRYLMPFVLQPEMWRKPQITKYSAAGYIFPGLAGYDLKDENLMAAYRKLPRAESPWVQFVDMLVSWKRG